MSLLVHSRAPDTDGVVIDITPESAGWRHVGFRVVKLEPGAQHSGGETGREACIVVLSGVVDIVAGGESFAQVGGRADVFAGSPASVYVPASVDYTVMTDAGAEIAVCTAPGTGAGRATLIPAADVGQETRGQGTNTRFVRNILPDMSPIAENLLVVEVITPGGNWSSYPPHKHDVDAYPTETLLEETYYHRLSPQQGYAIQRVYTDDRSLDETMAVHDGDAVLVPRGYHPVGAAHGYDLYYLNVMAGPRKAWKFTNDPAHDWIVRQ